jgi:hypothetical protein
LERYYGTGLNGLKLNCATSVGGQAQINTIVYAPHDRRDKLEYHAMRRCRKRSAYDRVNV